MVQALQYCAHLLCIGFLFFESLVVFIVDDVLFHPVLELILVLATLDIAVGHDPHNLFVVIEDAESWKLLSVAQECAVSIQVVFIFGICVSESLLMGCEAIWGCVGRRPVWWRCTAGLLFSLVP